MENEIALTDSRFRCRKTHTEPTRDLGPILLAWAASLLLLIFESDIGTSAVFMGLFVAMLYIATNRVSFGVVEVCHRFPHASRGNAWRSLSLLGASFAISSSTSASVPTWSRTS